MSNKALESLRRNVTGAIERGQAKAIVEQRSLHDIAAEIVKLWRPVNYAAKPYLMAMASLDKISDPYGEDSGVSIVLYFLSNAQTWKGPDARRIKLELKALAGVK